MLPYQDIIYDHFNPNVTIDILIIGAGLSGLQLAKDLGARNVTNAWLFEAGQNLGFQHIYSKYDDIYAQKLWQLLIEDPSYQRPWVSNTPPHYAGTSGLRRRLGGRSLYWHGGILRLEPWALDPTWWPESIISDLTQGSDGRPSFYEMQEREITSDRVTQGSELLAKLLQSVGYIHAQPMPLAVRRQQISSGDVRWAAYSPLDIWKQVLERFDNTSTTKLPRIACNTEVISVLAEKGMVSGVRVRNTQTKEIYEISCPCVVLAAGTIENTRLALGVLFSGGYIEQPVLSGLSDHLVADYMYHLHLDHIPPEWNSSQIPSFIVIPGTEVSRFNLFVSITRSNIDNNSIFIDTWGMGEQLPHPENIVYLNPAQPEPKLAYVSVSMSKSDQEMIRCQQQALSDLTHRLLRALGPSATILSHTSYASPEVVSNLSDALLKTLGTSTPTLNPIQYVSPLGTVDHEGGTLPFGSVLKDTGEFLNIRGLYAVGPCTFPRMGAANPSLTTLALAKRTAYTL
jgi:choline dehydrogenase-like flavoprotein